MKNGLLPPFLLNVFTIKKHTEILHDIQYLTSHHDVGFMINNSYGNGRNIDVPLNYADYYFIEVLVRKKHIENGENPIE